MGSEKIIIAMGEKHAWLFMRLVGASEVLDALQSVKGVAATTPGFGHAMALAERQVADLRANIGGEALRAVARAGHDITRVPSVYTQLHEGRPVLVIDPPDLLSGAV
jgi:hypothetical protein